MQVYHVQRYRIFASRRDYPPNCIHLSVVERPYLVIVYVPEAGRKSSGAAFALALLDGGIAAEFAPVADRGQTTYASRASIANSHCYTWQRIEANCI